MDQLATVSTFTTGVRPRDWPADESEGPAFMSDASQNENVSRPYWPLKPRKADAVNIVSRGMLLACAFVGTWAPFGALQRPRCRSPAVLPLHIELGMPAGNRRYGDDLAQDLLSGIKSPASLLSPHRSPHPSPCPPIFKASPRIDAAASSLANTPGAMLEGSSSFLSPPIFRHANNLPVPGPPVGGVPAGFVGSQVCHPVVPANVSQCCVGARMS